jgi:hypothetical protein
MTIRSKDLEADTVVILTVLETTMEENRGYGFTDDEVFLVTEAVGMKHKIDTELEEEQ